MTNKQVRDYFIEKEHTACPLTQDLIKSGYVQKANGYIAYAKECGIKDPTQYWHLIHSWSDRTDINAPFDKRIQCGELIFWMAEVSGAVDIKTLESLQQEILAHYRNDRRAGNRIIQEVCFDRIAACVEGAASAAIPVTK